MDSMQNPLLRRQSVVSPQLQLRTMRSGTGRIIQNLPILIGIIGATPQRDQIARRGTPTSVVHAQASRLILDAEPAATLGMHSPVLHREIVAIPQLRAGVVGGRPARVVQAQRRSLHTLEAMHRTLGGQTVPRRPRGVT